MRSEGFQSPTGNIRCAIQSDDETQLLCKTFNNGNAIDLDSVLEPNRNITASIPAEPTLAYGRVWSSPYFFCWSRWTAVTCRSLHSTYGFAINRTGVTELAWGAAVLHGGSGGAYSAGSGSYSAGPDTSGDFCSTHSCIGDWGSPSGSIVECADGTWSHSGGQSGACSWHGGER